MNPAFLSHFQTGQEMHRDDFEIFHYYDAASCNVALHSHDFYELYCLLNGQMDYIVEGRRYTLTPGTLLLIAPGEMHRPDVRAVPQEFERVVLWMRSGFIASLSVFMPHIVRSIAGEAAQGGNLITADEQTDQILQSLLFSLLYEAELNDADSLYMSHMLVTQLLVHLSRFLRQSAAVPKQPNSRYRETMQVYEYINQHLAEELTVTSLASRFYLDKNTLTRQFKRIIGLTPGEYIRRRRVESAHELITEGASMQEACDRCGFSDYSTFYRAFRQVYGISPSALGRANHDAEAERTADAV